MFLLCNRSGPIIHEKLVQSFVTDPIGEIKKINLSVHLLSWT